MKAMIFAAGLGTRLKPLTDTMPKALVPVAGEPMLAHIVRKLKEAGFDDIVVNVHHFAQQIIEYLSENEPDIAVSHEKDHPLETGGAIRYAAPLLKGCGEFLVHNVDIFSNLDIPLMLSCARPDALSTLLVSERKSSRHLLFDDGMRLVGWKNDNTGEVRSPLADFNPDSCRALAFGGVHLISEKALPLMESWPDKFSIIDFYLSVAAEYPIYGYVQDGLRLIDAGKIPALEEAGKLITRM